MEIQRIGRNPGGDSQRARSSQVSVHGGTVYLAVTPDRPFDRTVSVAEQTRQLLARLEERLVLAGSDKAHILIAQVWISDMRYFGEMNSVWDAWVDQGSPPSRACAACDLGDPNLKVEMVITAATV